MTDYVGIAALMTAVLTPVAVMLTAWLTNRRVRDVQRTTDTTLRYAQSTDHAVNGKDPRESTISEVVDRIDRKQERDMPSSGDEGLLPLVRKLSVAVEQIQKQLEIANGGGH